MSWWNRRSREGNVVRLPRIDDNAVPKLPDINCVACYLKNESGYPLTFVSQLENIYPQLIEAKSWVSFVLQAGEKKLVPHRYWDILPHDVERSISVIEIPKGHEPVEFLYQTRVIEKGSGGEVLHSQSEDSCRPSLDAASQPKK